MESAELLGLIEEASRPDMPKGVDGLLNGDADPYGSGTGLPPLWYAERGGVADRRGAGAAGKAGVPMLGGGGAPDVKGGGYGWCGLTVVGGARARGADWARLWGRFGVSSGEECEGACELSPSPRLPAPLLGLPSPPGRCRRGRPLRSPPREGVHDLLHDLRLPVPSPRAPEGRVGGQAV